MKTGWKNPGTLTTYPSCFFWSREGSPLVREMNGKSWMIPREKGNDAVREYSFLFLNNIFRSIRTRKWEFFKKESRNFLFSYFLYYANQHKNIHSSRSHCAYGHHRKHYLCDVLTRKRTRTKYTKFYRNGTEIFLSGYESIYRVRQTHIFRKYVPMTGKMKEQ